MGFIKLNNFQLNDKIRVVSEKESNWSSFEGTPVNIKNDSLVLSIDEEENIEIHFNYKGIHPDSGISKIEKIETSIPVGEIIYQSEEETYISDFIDIDEKDKLYTINDKKDDYINKSLSSLPPNINKKKEYSRIINEIETWLKLEEKEKVDYSKTLYNNYLENNFSNKYLLPITADKRKIYIGNEKEDVEEPEDDEKYYQILGNSNTISKDCNISSDILETLNDKNIKKEQAYIVGKKNELWESLSSYLSPNDCETNNISKNTLTVRDNKTSKSYCVFSQVKEIDFDTRILLADNDFGIDENIGEQFCLTGHMRLPYTFRTKVDMSEGIYTVKDIVKNPHYKSLEDVYNEIGEMELDYDYEDIKEESVVTICQKQEDDTIIKLTGTVESITENKIILKNIDHPELSKKKKTLSLDRNFTDKAKYIN